MTTRSRLRRVLPVAAAVGMVVGSLGCGQLGYSARVLHRIPSPDGKLVAVCQEVPEFDGPGYDVRIEDNAGTTQAHVFRGFDADPCDEMMWSADGRALAVVARYRALARVIDISSSLATPPVLIDNRPNAPAFPRSPFVKEFDFSADGTIRQARALRFVAPGHFEVSVCAYDWERYRQTREFHCTAETTTERLALPQKAVAVR